MSKKPKRIPAEEFPVGTYIKEELDARGWTPETLAFRMCMGDYGVTLLALQMLIAVPEARLDEETAKRMASALGVSHQFLLNLQDGSKTSGELIPVLTKGESAT